MKFSGEEWRFMSALIDGRGYSWELPLADRTQDRARQRLRRMGLVAFDRKHWKWTATPEGLKAWRGGQDQSREATG